VIQQLLPAAPTLIFSAIPFGQLAKAGVRQEIRVVNPVKGGYDFP
jgi:hypothetical protein